MIEMKKILLATDFSECSDAALGYAAGLATEYGAKLTIAHVVQVPDLYGPYEVWTFNRKAVEDQLVAESRKHLDELAAAKVPKELAVETRVLLGIPTRAIVELAQHESFDLVVLGTHGRGGLSHLVMGSVAERVVRYAPCPVLTVREAPKKAA